MRKGRSAKLERRKRAKLRREHNLIKWIEKLEAEQFSKDRKEWKIKNIETKINIIRRDFDALSTYGV